MGVQLSMVEVSSQLISETTLIKSKPITIATNTTRNLCYVHHEFKYKEEDIDFKNYNIHEKYHVDKGQLVSEAIFSWRQISQKASNIF